MGGEDWQLWIDALDEAGVLADGAKTTAFTYLGEKVTHDIYWNGSIGAAKKDLDQKVLKIRERLAAKGVSVLKAVVTQASSAIPIMPLYLSLLFKVMKEQGVHEGCIEQVYGLYKDSLYSPTPILDEDGRLRADYKELAPEVQDLVAKLWDQVTTENLNELTDFAGYKAEFLRLFGFGVEGVDYDADVSPDVAIPASLAAPMTRSLPRACARRCTSLAVSRPPGSSLPLVVSSPRVLTPAEGAAKLPGHVALVGESAHLRRIAERVDAFHRQAALCRTRPGRPGMAGSVRLGTFETVRLTDERTDSPDPVQPRRRLRLQDFAAGLGSDPGRQRRPEPRPETLGRQRFAR